MGFDLGAVVSDEKYDVLHAGRGELLELAVEERPTVHGNEHLRQVGPGDVLEPRAETTGEDGDRERHSATMTVAPR